MPLVVRNLSLRLDEPEESLRKQIARVLDVPAKAIRSFGVIRRAVDARKHDDIRRVYHVEVAVDGNEQRLLRRGRPGQVSALAPDPIEPIDNGTDRIENRPVIIGTGPAGLFAAFLLAERGYRPLVLERGQDVPQRHKALHLYYTQGKFDPENNLLFGIGGAGTYSDGKLYSRTHDARNAFVLEQLVRFGADPDICVNAKPHLGSDKLPGVCRRMVEHIRSQGGEIRYGAKVTDFDVTESLSPHSPTPPLPHLSLRAVILESGERIETSACILAVGHSARDTYRVLRQRGVAMQAKPFQMGVRIEHPQELIDRNQLGAAAAGLGAADYMLVARNAAATCVSCGPDLFTFCMCPGGSILPSNESPHEICTNGASNSRRNTPFANSGLVVTILPSEFGDDPLLGVEYQRRWERLAYELSGSYAVPAQRAADFLAQRLTDGQMATSFPLGARAVDLRGMLPKLLTQALERGLPMLDRMIPGYASAEGIMTAPETRASSPVRIPRDDQTRQSISVARLYPVGEGAGYAGGIVSSATDGMKTAETIIRQFSPIL
jgi:uncharacterized FAD-dependent dehydrogenase